jgi:tetrapyrrole methylase family protein/MazG family protein/ATP diphosphatase
MSAPTPPAHGSDLPGLRRLLAVVAALRAENGCPWDRQQSEASMAPHLVEEAFEAADALRRGDRDAAREELGDVLVNVALIAQISRESGGFDADAMADAAAAKLVRRHPHVFGDAKVDGAEAAYRNWERQKQAEAAAAGTSERRGALAGVPVALPALLRAFRIGEKAARAGFDWPDRAGPRAKIDEELAELDRAIANGDGAEIAAELGDALFSLVNLARHLGVNPETALATTTDKFQRRFAAVERAFDFDLRGRSLAELDAAWTAAKRAEAGAGDDAPTR